MFLNRRKHERIAVKECIVEGYSMRWTCNGQVMDISDGGMRIDLDGVPEMHEEVQLYMTCVNGRELTRKAIVVWFIKKIPPEVGAMVGLQFI